jgi:AAA+ superfamily predicted ATPase
VLEELSRIKGWLSLAGLSELTHRQAQILVRTEGALYLDALTQISDDTAIALGTHAHDLYLDGVKSLTPQAAEGLAECQGDLYLNGLCDLDAPGAEALSHHAGHLHLDGLRSISRQVAQHLAAHRGTGLNLQGLGLMTGSVKEILRQYRGSLYAPGVDNTPPAKLGTSTGSQSGERDKIANAGDTTHHLLTQARADLEKLVGLAGVKKEISDLIQFLRTQRLRTSQGLKAAEISRHLVFSGNPGTGKTTVARIVGQIYKAAGFLSRGHTVEVDRSALVAEYIGQTAVKTLKACKRSMGGVLFIDEAYSLAPPDHHGSDFGKEAIDTLLKFMEDNRDDVVVIVAGYPAKMEAFLNANPGMQSRFNKRITFENYTPDELLLILKRMCDEGEYVLSDDAETAALAVFTDECEVADDSFGNARYVRNSFEQALLEHGQRMGQLESPTRNDLQTLTAEDFIGDIDI